MSSTEGVLLNTHIFVRIQLSSYSSARLNLNLTWDISMGLMEQMICRSDNIYLVYIRLIINVFNTSTKLVNNNHRSPLSSIIDDTF